MRKLPTNKSVEYEQGFVAGVEWHQEHARRLAGVPIWRYVLLVCSCIILLGTVLALGISLS